MKREKDDYRGNSKMPQREHLLQRALELTMGARNQAYGAPAQNHNEIALLWSAYFNARVGHSDMRIVDLDGEDVAMCMVLLKVARAAQRTHIPDPLNEDTFADMVAYAAIAGECREERIADDLRPLVAEG